MAVILSINCSLDTASVILSSDGNILGEEQNSSQKDHASFLQPAVKKVCSAADINLEAIDAISVVNGPGSYTGLRVGLSSAKALCYALNKPLILLNTLDAMAYALKLQSSLKNKNVVFCPMIDARRMEVYTALYNIDLELINEYAAEIIDDTFLKKERNIYSLIVGGNGSEKLKSSLKDADIVYINPLFISKPTVILSGKFLELKKFSNVAYSEPFYLKPVYFKK